MQLITVTYDDHLDTEPLHKAAEGGNVVLVKNLISHNEAVQFREQLCQWRTQTPSHDPLDYYPKGVLNLHIEVKNLEPESREDENLDYHERYTRFNMYNFRIGDMLDDFIQRQVPQINVIGPRILNLFQSVLKRPLLRHGERNSRNLYFEVAQFPCGTGLIEEHTHQSILQYGQPINMVVALSSQGTDFASGGLVVRGRNQVLDLQDRFEQGDAVFFRNDLPHWVTPVTGDQPSHFLDQHGRWSLTMFYY